MVERSLVRVNLIVFNTGSEAGHWWSLSGKGSLEVKRIIWWMATRLVCRRVTMALSTVRKASDDS